MSMQRRSVRLTPMISAASSSYRSLRFWAARTCSPISSTVKILTTLTRADEGEARVAGFDVRAEPGRARRAIGVAGQEPGVDADATGEEELVLQGTLYRLL